MIYGKGNREKKRTQSIHSLNSQQISEIGLFRAQHAIKSSSCIVTAKSIDIVVYYKFVQKSELIFRIAIHDDADPWQN